MTENIEAMEKEIQEKQEKVSKDIELSKMMLDQLLRNVQKTEQENEALKLMLINQQKKMANLYFWYKVLVVVQFIFVILFFMK